MDLEQSGKLNKVARGEVPGVAMLQTFEGGSKHTLSEARLHTYYMVRGAIARRFIHTELCVCVCVYPLSVAYTRCARLRMYANTDTV